MTDIIETTVSQESEKGLQEDPKVLLVVKETIDLLLKFKNLSKSKVIPDGFPKTKDFFKNGYNPYGTIHDPVTTKKVFCKESFLENIFKSRKEVKNIFQQITEIAVNQHSSTTRKLYEAKRVEYSTSESLVDFSNLENNVRAILNKISEKNFHKLVGRFCRLNIKNEDGLKLVISVLFEYCVKFNDKAPVYSRLCQQLYDSHGFLNNFTLYKTIFDEDPEKEEEEKEDAKVVLVTDLKEKSEHFKGTLLGKCQKVFYSSLRRRQEKTKLTNEEEIELERVRRKEEVKGNMIFIGSLYNETNGLLGQRIIVEVIKSSIMGINKNMSNENNIELIVNLCKFITIVGEKLDAENLNEIKKLDNELKKMRREVKSTNMNSWASRVSDSPVIELKEKIISTEAKKKQVEGVKRQIDLLYGFVRKLSKEKKLPKVCQFLSKDLIELRKRNWKKKATANSNLLSEIRSHMHRNRAFAFSPKNNNNNRFRNRNPVRRVNPNVNPFPPLMGIVKKKSPPKRVRVLGPNWETKLKKLEEEEKKREEEKSLEKKITRRIGGWKKIKESKNSSFFGSDEDTDSDNDDDFFTYNAFPTPSKKSPKNEKSSEYQKKVPNKPFPVPRILKKSDNRDNIVEQLVVLDNPRKSIRGICSNSPYFQAFGLSWILKATLDVTNRVNAHLFLVTQDVRFEGILTLTFTETKISSDVFFDVGDRSRKYKSNLRRSDVWIGGNNVGVGFNGGFEVSEDPKWVFLVRIENTGKLPKKKIRMLQEEEFMNEEVPPESEEEGEEEEEEEKKESTKHQLFRGQFLYYFESYLEDLDSSAFVDDVKKDFDDGGEGVILDILWDVSIYPHDRLGVSEIIGICDGMLYSFVNDLKFVSSESHQARYLEFLKTYLDPVSESEWNYLEWPKLFEFFVPFSVSSVIFGNCGDLREKLVDYLEVHWKNFCERSKVDKSYSYVVSMFLVSLVRYFHLSSRVGDEERKILGEMIVEGKDFMICRFLGEKDSNSDSTLFLEKVLESITLVLEDGELGVGELVDDGQFRSGWKEGCRKDLKYILEQNNTHKSKK